MSGTLYLVGTPIGNLGDMTARALDVIKSVDLIACEDTRRTLRMLNSFSVKKQLISYYKQKEKEGAEVICAHLSEGKNVALVSDAGMPCISDPGAVVVQKARQEGFDVKVVPGATAFASAVALCGISSGFTFLGFPPEKDKDIDKLFSKLKTHPLPLVFYVAPHDVNKFLKKAYERVGERVYYAVKELTKIYESVFVGVLGKDEIGEPKGEFVLIVMPEEKEEEAEVSDEMITESLRRLLMEGEDKKTAIKTVAKELNVSKNVVYRLALSL